MVLLWWNNGNWKLILCERVVYCCGLDHGYWKPILGEGHMQEEGFPSKYSIDLLFWEIMTIERSNTVGKDTCP